MSKKIVSFCLLLMILFTLAVPVFAEEYVIDNWYNTQQPINEDFYFRITNGDYYLSTYDSVSGLSFKNPSYSTVNDLVFGVNDSISSGGWAVSMIPSYDYFVNVIVWGDVDNSSQFTFYPQNFTLGYQVHDNYIAQSLDQISFSHYDQEKTLGFSVVGQIPVNDYFGCPIRDFAINGSGSIPSNLHVAILLYQVPQGDGSTSVAAIIESINNQTRILGNLIQGNGGDPDADSANSELSDVIGQVDHIEQDIHLQAQEAFNAADSVINQFDPAAFSDAGNLYKQLSQSAFSSLGLISVFILIPLILFCVGAFIGKLK